MADAVETMTGFVDVQGAPLHYQVAGTGPALVLIHEGIADSRMYDDQFGALATYCRVVRYDMHGFGQSGAPDEAYTHHEALHALLRHLDIDRAALLGMSLGGAVAIDFTLTYPTMVDALLLLAAGIGGYPTGGETAALGAPIAAAFETRDYARAFDLLLRLWVDGTDRSAEEVDSTVRQRVYTMMTAAMARRGREPTPLDPPAYTRLSEIAAPTLVVVGTGDVPDIRDQAKLLEQTIVGARGLVLPHVAHVFNMECPAEVNRMILDFLAAQRLIRIAP